MSCIIKCNNCNIVIDELLCYVQNKISICDEESLVKICLSTYTTEQIQRSVTLLFESFSSNNVRKIDRKGRKKESRVLYDILNVFKVTDPDILPVFVAREIEKLPPITFDHLDVSKLLKDLMLVQEDIKLIKSSYATVNQLEEIKKECFEVKNGSPPFSAIKDNMKRGAYIDSGPIGLSRFDESCVIHAEDDDVTVPTLDIQNQGRCKKLANKITQPTHGGTQLIHASDNTARDESLRESTEQSADDNCTNKAGRRPDNDSYAEVLKSNKEWTLVRKKSKPLKNRIEGKKGTLVVKDDEMFRAAERLIPLFITNVHKNTSELDIVRYICKVTEETVMLEKIPIRRECDYNAYKFSIAQNKLSLFLDEKIWPEGIIFRRFFNFKKRRETVINRGDPTVPQNGQ
jgi:hypothetical protein